MHALTLKAHGDPNQVLSLEPLRLGDLADGEIRVQVRASPIDPVDLLVIQGLYPLLPSLPAIPGLEGMGQVIAAGAGAESWLGARVLLPMRAGPWATHTQVQAERCLRLPEGLDDQQAAMLRLNPPTAWDLLSGLPPGSWVIQSPGAGAVGQAVIQLARVLGLHTISLIRRPERRARLEALGADLVLDQDQRGLRRTVRGVVGDAPLPRALDGSGGALTERLASCIDPAGEVICYGATTRQPAQLSVRNSIFREIRLRGYWLLRENRVHPDAEDARLSRLAEIMIQDRLRLEVAQVFPLERWQEAFALARDSRRCGRVLLAPTP